MREVKRSALVNKPPGELFALINDIESYPQFLPWVTHAQVLSRTPGQLIASIGVRQGALQGEFTTRNTLEPERSVRMQLLQGTVPHPRRRMAAHAHRRRRLPRRAQHALRLHEPRRGAAVRVEVRRHHRFAGRCVRGAGAGAPVTPVRAGKRCTVAYATRARQYLWQLALPPAATVADALAAARVVAHETEADSLGQRGGGHLR